MKSPNACQIIACQKDSQYVHKVSKDNYLYLCEEHWLPFKDQESAIID